MPQGIRRSVVASSQNIADTHRSWTHAESPSKHACTHTDMYTLRYTCQDSGWFQEVTTPCPGGWPRVPHGLILLRPPGLRAFALLSNNFPTPCSPTPVLVSARALLRPPGHPPAPFTRLLLKLLSNPGSHSRGRWQRPEGPR